MKIPRRLNAVLDRAANNARAILITLPLVVAAAAALWMPALAAFAIGVAVAGVAVHIRMSARVARLRAEADDLLRENGALRHEKTMLTKRTAASGVLLTQRLPIIPEQDDK